MLLSASQERTGELADEISRAAPVTAVALFVAHEGIHSEALFPCQSSPSLMPKCGISYAQSTSSVTGRAVAHASCSIAGIWA